MDLAKYEELTGTTVAEGKKAHYEAVIRRANVLLDSALGYSLSPAKNLDKEELGKVQFQGAYPYYPINRDSLLPADEQEGSYRLFYYNPSDVYIKTDPFRNAYHVKLVQAQNDDEFVTIWDLEGFTAKTYRKFGRFIEKQATWFNWNWYGWLVGNLGSGNGLMVAVDADWLTCNNVPEDLAYLWVDMVTYYASDDIAVTGNLKSESVNGHSYSYEKAIPPHEVPENVKVIQQYAGPNGTAAVRNRA